MRMIEEIIKVQIKTRSKDLKITYDIQQANIISLTVSNGEQERTSTCEIEIYETQDDIVNTLLNKISEDGAIIVPMNFFGDPETEENTAGDTSGTTTGSFTGSLEDVKEGTKGDELATIIVGYSKSVGVTDLSHIAYILASVDHESLLGTYTSEIGGSSMSYAPWYGRGLIQLTHESNYKIWSDKLGVDFIANPDSVSLLKYAIPIAVLGMKEGSFTGVGLSDYGSGDSFDFRNARKIVNGLDRADDIADIARKYLSRLKNGELGMNAAGKSASTKADSFKQVNPITDLDATGDIAAINSEETTDTQEIDPNEELFTRISIQWRYSNESSFNSFEYIFTGIKVKENSLIISGGSIDAVIAASIPSDTEKTYINVTLRSLANDVAKQLGITINIFETELSEEVVSIQAVAGESAYNTLVRLAKSKGYIVRSDAFSLTLEPIIASEASFQLLPTRYASYPTFTEEASANRIFGEGLPPIVTGLTKTTNSNGKTEAYKTEAFRQVNPLVVSIDSGGSSTASRGVNTLKPAVGTASVKPGLNAILSVASDIEGVDPNLPESVSAQQALNAGDQKVAKQGDTEEYVKNIEEGKEVGQGFRVNLNYYRDHETLSIPPGSVINLPAIDSKSKIYSDYRLGFIEHRYPEGISTFNLYKPVWIKPNKKDEVSAPTNGSPIKSTVKGLQIVETARSFEGKLFNGNEDAQCCIFVRTVYSMNGIELPVTADPFDNYLPTSSGFANSLAGVEIGEVFTDRSQLMPGDLLFWFDTYSSPEWGDGTITHVGIFTEGTNMIDRSTKSKPVTERPIDTFAEFACAVRPKQLIE